MQEYLSTAGGANADANQLVDGSLNGGRMLAREVPVARLGVAVVEAPCPNISKTSVTKPERHETISK